MLSFHLLILTTLHSDAFTHAATLSMQTFIQFFLEFHMNLKSLQNYAHPRIFANPFRIRSSILEVDWGQRWLWFFVCVLRFCVWLISGEMAGNCLALCRSGSSWWIKRKKLPKTMPPLQTSTARTSRKGAITSLRTCSACTKRWVRL